MQLKEEMFWLRLGFVLVTLFYCQAFSFDHSESESITQSETIGACSDQLNPQLHKRNCRYGKCEQINNGTDFVCHCEEVNLTIHFINHLS